MNLDDNTDDNTGTTATITDSTKAVGRVSGAYADKPTADNLPAPVPRHRMPKNISLGGLLDMTVPEREHLVFPWLRQKESAMIYAAPGVGKSLVALSLALAVAGGGKVLGKWTTPKPRRVLFVDGEMPLDDIKARAEMLLPATGGDVEAARMNLHIEARQFQPAGRDFTDLNDAASREALLYRLTRARADLVILDNLSTLATVEDENAAGNFNDAVKFLLRLKQEGVACLLVHHSNKSGESYRGSSKIATTFEAILKLGEAERKDTDRPDTTRFRLSWDKLRGKREEDTGVSLDFALETKLFDKSGEGEEKGQLRWTSSLSEDGQLGEFLELVRSGECRSMRELAAALGVRSTDTIFRWKKKALASGRITEEEWQEYLPGRLKAGGSRKARPDDDMPITTATAAHMADTESDY